MNTYTFNTRSVAAACFAVMLVMFVSVALPHIVFAQDDGDYGDDDSGCCDTSDYGSADIYPDSSDYGSADIYPDDTSDYGSADIYPDSTDYGSADIYPDDTSDYGSADIYPDSTDYGSADIYPDTVYDSTSPDYSETDYSTDEYDTAETDEYGEDYSTGGSSYSQPFSIGAPESYGYSTPISAPIIPSAPVVQNIPIAYQQQQQQQQQQEVAQPSVTTVTNDTCTNYSCNTTTNISNSGNTTTVIPVTETPVTYPAQYTFPSNVSCTISASQNSVQSGQYTFLTWESYGATSATLTNYGNVAPNGSLSVQPYGSIEYVLTVYGQNGQTSTCNTYVTTANSYPSVTLSQIPYTGFDFGTVGDTMYWALLAIFALAAGYLLVYYKGGMGAFAGAMAPARKTSVSTVKVQKKTVTPAPVVEKRVETPAPAKAMPADRQVATLESLPAFSNVRPTSDSMSIASHDGAPRIVISRN